MPSDIKVKRVQGPSDFRRNVIGQVICLRCKEKFDTKEELAAHVKSTRTLY